MFAVFFLREPIFADHWKITKNWNPKKFGHTVSEFQFTEYKWLKSGVSYKGNGIYSSS